MNIRELGEDKVKKLLLEVVNVTGCKEPDSYGPIISGLQSGRFKLYEAQEFRKAFKMYAEGELDYKEKAYTLSLKFIGDVLNSYNRHKKPDTRPERQPIKPMKQVGDYSGKAHFQALINIMDKWGEIPAIAMWSKAYTYGVQSGQIKPMKHGELDQQAKIVIRQQMTEHEEKVGRAPTRQQITSMALRLYMENWCAEYLRKQGKEPKKILQNLGT